MNALVPRLFASAAAAACLAGVLPAVASATDYCVVPNAGCGGTNVENFKVALDKADDANDPDRIFLGATTYVAPTASGFDYSQSGAPVEIIGKGAGQTVLTSPSGASNVLRLFGGEGSSVHDLGIRAPADVAYGFVGLSTDDTARRIDVSDDPQQLYERKGVHLENGGALEDSSVTLAGATQTTAVWIDAGGGTVRNSTLAAYLGVASAHGGTIERCRFAVSGIGVAGGGNVTTITSSVMQIFAQHGVGILASPQPGSPATINADGMTIVGPGRNASRAAAATTFGAPAENGDVNLTNSIVRGSSFEVIASGAGHAWIAISYTDLDPGDNEFHGANGKITEANMSNVGDAGFADPLLGDYHLLSSSPLIDAGDPSTAQGADMDGKPLVVDGNGDATARRDMGAFEYQTGLAGGGDPAPAGGAGGTSADTQAPLIGNFRATPSLFALARAATPVAAALPHATRFRYGVSEQARVTLKIERALPGRRAGGRCVRPSARLRQAQRCTRYVSVGTLRRTGAKGANSIRFTGRIGKRALRPGRYRAVIAATDAAGNRSALRTARFRVAAG
jgi:hypothetical protein